MNLSPIHIGPYEPKINMINKNWRDAIREILHIRREMKMDTYLSEDTFIIFEILLRIYSTETYKKGSLWAILTEWVVSPLQETIIDEDERCLCGRKITWFHAAGNLYNLNKIKIGECCYPSLVKYLDDK